MNPPHPPSQARSVPAKALTIAGSDSGAGAGIQADLKTFAAFGVYGTSALTAVTAQNTRGVFAVAEVPEDVIALQIDVVLEDIGADAVKPACSPRPRSSKSSRTDWRPGAWRRSSLIR